MRMHLIRVGLGSLFKKFNETVSSGQWNAEMKWLGNHRGKAKRGVSASKLKPLFLQQR